MKPHVSERLPALLVLACMAHALPASANGATVTGRLPTVEVVGSSDRLPDIAGSASIIDNKEIKQSHAFTVNEALRKMPGVNVRDEEGIGLRPNIGLRGLNPTRSTKVLLLEDGLPLAYAPYGDNASYYHPPIERFESIEILKGSEQVLFGPQTIGGVLNYITPTPPQEFGGRLNLTGGNRDYFNGGLSLGGKGMLLNFAHKQSDGSRDNENSEMNDVALKSVINLTPNQAITLKASYFNEDSQLSYTGLTDAELRNFGYRYNPFENDQFTTDRWGASASHEIAFNDAVVLTTNFYFTHFNRDWWRQSSTTTDSQCGAGFSNARLAGERVDPDTCNSTEGRLRSYYTYGVEPRLLADYTMFGIRNEFQTGVRAHFEMQDRTQIIGAQPTARSGRITEDNERDVDAYSLFAQNRFFLGQFTLTPGFRVEYVENIRANGINGTDGDDDLAEVIPGVGVTFNPLETLTLFGGVHKGFAPPRTEDLIGTSGLQATFTDVDPEESLNAEFGFRAEPVPGARVESTLFRNDFDNQIMVGSIAGGSTPLAQGETLYEGLELFLRLDSHALMSTRHNAYLQAAYTWLPTAEQTTAVTEVASGALVQNSRAGLRLPYAPENLSTTTLGITLENGLDLRLEAVYVGSQYADFANTEVAGFNGNGQVGLIKSNLIFNAAATYPLQRWGASLFLTAKNLADRDYIADRTRGIRVGMPLLVQGGVEFAF
ncbi:MAG: hypothetical protein RL434_337 [Pseudomonadota bacterium]|jgi:Fe(3+) dicitrate transport protein